MEEKKVEKGEKRRRNIWEAFIFNLFYLIRIRTTNRLLTNILILLFSSFQIHSTDFSRKELFEELLVRLLSAFSELKQHEEIENKYIMRELKRRLHGEQLHRWRMI